MSFAEQKRVGGTNACIYNWQQTDIYNSSYVAYLYHYMLVVYIYIPPTCIHLNIYLTVPIEFTFYIMVNIYMYIKKIRPWYISK